MIVSYLTPNLGISGGVKVKLEHATRLAERGHQVTLVVTKRSKPTTQDWFPLDKRVRVIALNPDELKAKLPDADVLVANHWPYCQDLPPSKGKLLVPRQIEEPVTDEQLKEMTRKPDLWLPNSPQIEKALYKQKIRNLHLVQNGVNHEWFNPKGRTFEKKILTQLNLKKRRKGGPETLAVLGEVHRRFPKVEIWGFGQRDKSGYGEVPREMRFWKCGPMQLPELYKQCGIYFYAALLDGFANSPAEAMACGCITVTSYNAGTPFAIPGACFTFKPGDNKEAVRLLVRVLEEWNTGNWVEEMSTRASNKMKEYSWERSVDQLEEAMRRVV